MQVMLCGKALLAFFTRLLPFLNMLLRGANASSAFQNAPVRKVAES